eukprot:3932795-Rhodomonas_salina.1
MHGGKKPSGSKRQSLIKLGSERSSLGLRSTLSVGHQTSIWRFCSCVCSRSTAHIPRSFSPSSALNRTPQCSIQPRPQNKWDVRARFKLSGLGVQGELGQHTVLLPSGVVQPCVRDWRGRCLSRAASASPLAPASARQLSQVSARLHPDVHCRRSKIACRFLTSESSKTAEKGLRLPSP